MMRLTMSCQFLVCVWFFAMHPLWVCQSLPDPLFGLWQDGLTVTDVLPALPTTTVSAFDMGTLYHQYERYYIGSQYHVDTLPSSSALADAGKSLGLNRPLTHAELKNMRRRLLDGANNIGLGSRVLGLFTLFNVFLIIGAIGIMATCLPVLSVCCKPLCKPLIRHITMLFYLLRDPLLHVGTIACVIQGGRYSPETGMYSFSFLGALAGCAFALTPINNWSIKNSVPMEMMMGVFVSLTFMPLAVLYASQLYGFIAVCALYGALGFSVLPMGMCWLIGFDRKETMHRVATTSLLLMILTAAARLVVPTFSTAQIMFQPFGTSIMVMTNVTYFLALLISSNSWANSDTVRAQIVMIVSLFIVLAYGTIFALAPLVNTGIVFTCLYVGEKIADRSFWKDNVAILIFFFSITIITVAFYLRTHPNLVVSLFTPFF